LLSVPTPLSVQVTGALAVSVTEPPGATAGLEGVIAGPEVRGDLTWPGNSVNIIMRQNNALTVPRTAEASTGEIRNVEFI